jgi:signal peptidase I
LDLKLNKENNNPNKNSQSKEAQNRTSAAKKNSQDNWLEGLSQPLNKNLENLLEKWYAFIQSKTEKLLTWRKRRKFILKERQARKHPIRDWTEVILSAVLIVLLINQYLFQAYQIPTGSMQRTLEIGDRIFVNKLVYGPELIPGQFKLGGFAVPKRGDIVIFESPNYRPKGVVFEVLHRIIYMLTFTLVNIDVDDRGDVAVHFLVKRVIGAPGDRIRSRAGEMEFLPKGETVWISEEQMKKVTELSYPNRRLFDTKKYSALETFYTGETRKSEGLPALVDTEQASQELRETTYLDMDYYKMVTFRSLYEIRPHVRKNGEKWRKYDLGWYIPLTKFFPMGDNRDNSKDARFFGPVKMQKVLGKASFRFWPLSRVGTIK